ncbi:MAG: ABC transporter permease [Candidatus Paceibacterales bacterium]
MESEVLIEPPHNWLNIHARELWQFRELLFFLVWRDIKIRYKQTLIGAAWAVFQPVLTMLVFSVIFGNLLKTPSDGIPYPLFSFAALIPWQLFSRALSDSANSLINNQQMVTKIYFPRLFLPASSILGGILDFGISMLVLFAMMFFYKVKITWAIFTLPLFLLLAVLTSLAVGIWLSALNVKYRDVKYVLPFLLQIWLYATPIAYSTQIIPEKWRFIAGLNPMTGVVNGFRWALLGQTSETSTLLGVSVAIILFLFITGLLYFQYMEQTFADIV